MISIVLETFVISWDFRDKLEMTSCQAWKFRDKLEMTFSQPESFVISWEWYFLSLEFRDNLENLLSLGFRDKFGMNFI